MARTGQKPYGPPVFTITLHDPTQDSDEELAERVAYTNELRREVLPDDPPITVEQVAAALAAQPDRIHTYAFRLKDADGALVGNATTSVDAKERDNPDVLAAGINVLPAHRRQGHGTKLLAELVALADSLGKTRIVGDTYEGVDAGAAFAEAVGGTARQANHMNHLPLAEVDRPMLERWVAEAADRSSDYELIGWDGPVPDEHVADWLDLVLVMNTAPKDDLELNDFTFTEEQLRDAERVARAVHQEDWVLVARHRATGEWAGFHNVGWEPNQPRYVYVGATGVMPEHRGHALGKWLKAAMTLRILDERPDATNIRTGNADSNDAMLGINRLMGYRPLLGQMTWELPVEEAAAALRARGISIPG
jgi:mycothiol synthase